MYLREYITFFKRSYTRDASIYLNVNHAIIITVNLTLGKRWVWDLDLSKSRVGFRPNNSNIHDLTRFFT